MFIFLIIQIILSILQLNNNNIVILFNNKTLITIYNYKYGGIW